MVFMEKQENAAEMEFYCPVTESYRKILETVLLAYKRTTNNTQ